MKSGDAARRATIAFVEQFGQRPDALVRAPGRVNLIGEHTDYNDGFVLPMALPHATWIALRPRNDRRVAVSSEGYGSTTIALDALDRSETGWARYLHAMAWVLAEEHGVEVPLVGWEGTIATDVPGGASLSSSAAIEIATALAFSVASGFVWDPVRVAELAQRAENDWVGMPCGIMDQLISATATAGHAKLIDCRSLAMTDRPLPSSVEIIVLDTASRRELVDSEYADRRAVCERVAAAGSVAALRDLDLEGLSDLELSDVERRRATHVITENERTLAAASAMDDGRVEDLGALMVESHNSLRDDYEVSGPDLDRMVEAALQSTGCLGARMTGAGFAGCAVALVHRDSADRFVEEVADRYRAGGTLQPMIHRCLAAAGAERASLD